MAINSKSYSLMCRLNKDNNFCVDFLSTKYICQTTHTGKLKIQIDIHIAFLLFIT